MAAITTGGSTATIKSTTAEGQLVEAFDFLQIQEAQVDKNPNSRDYIQTSYDVNAGLFTGIFNFDYIRSTGTGGEAIISVPTYLSSVTFSAGASGTFKSANPAAYLFEVARYIRELENNTTLNPQQKRNVSITYYDDISKVTGSFKCGFTLGLNSTGTRTITIVPYLL